MERFDERRPPPEEPRPYERDVSTKKVRARHSGWRDPHMFTVIRGDGVEFWYGIHGPNGDHRRFALPLDVAYAFFKRQAAKIERIHERRGQPLPVVPLDDIDEYVSDALQGLPDGNPVDVDRFRNLEKGEFDERGEDGDGTPKGTAEVGQGGSAGST